MAIANSMETAVEALRRLISNTKQEIERTEDAEYKIKLSIKLSGFESGIFDSKPHSI